MKHARPDYDRIQDPAGNIPDDEPVFLLRAQDETAAETVAFWAGLQPNGPLRDMAMNHARRMAEWPTKKTADLYTQKNCCENCRFYRADISDAGTCCRRPPVIVGSSGDGHQEALQPFVYCNDWCGEWERANERQEGGRG